MFACKAFFMFNSEKKLFQQHFTSVKSILCSHRHSYGYPRLVFPLQFQSSTMKLNWTKKIVFNKMQLKRFTFFVEFSAILTITEPQKISLATKCFLLTLFFGLNKVKARNVKSFSNLFVHVTSKWDLFSFKWYPTHLCSANRCIDNKKKSTERLSFLWNTTSFTVELNVNKFSTGNILCGW